MNLMTKSAFRIGRLLTIIALHGLLISATPVVKTSAPSAPSAVTNNSAKNPSSVEKASGNSAKNTPGGTAESQKKAMTQAKIKEEKKVGGVLYEQYATALHTKRLRSEFTRAQWKTILLQKRIRIPLTAQDHHEMELFFIGE